MALTRPVMDMAAILEGLGSSDYDQQLRDQILNLHTICVECSRAIVELEQTFETIYPYAQSMTHHVYFELGKIIGVPGKITTIEDAMVPDSFDNIVDLMYDRSLEEARNRMLYEGLYSFIKPVELMRRTISQTQQYLHVHFVPFEEPDNSTLDKLTTQELDDRLDAYHSSLDKLIDILQHISEQTRKPQNEIDENVLELREDKDNLAWAEVYEWEQFKDNSAKRNEILEKLVDTLSSAEEGKTIRKKLEKGQFSSGWRGWRARVYYDDFEDFETHLQNFDSALHRIHQEAKAGV
ncbi:hypothetical protein N0V83_004333 [Neocucurbitaria cava]|uniref:Uncharacterized protein n=1 Tax=Neocucurbitaria cava TaxID=798079 RepID=A0A9W9CN27_9PLEO|nr:hypothetical protein N0V83_004333 [Neocucurbitaria cava]